MEIEKKTAGEKAVEFIENGMTLGLGTGSTVYYTIVKIGELVRKGLNIKAVSTSSKTTELAKSLGINIVPLDSVENIDLVIDGADEIDSDFNAIKGGGGALLYEKIVASLAKRVIWIVDSGKIVKKLGRFPLPVEIIPFGHTHTVKGFQKAGMNPVLRQKDGSLYITDSGNYIVDLHLGEIDNPCELSVFLNSRPGVVENGLFLKMSDIVIVGRGNTAEIINCK